MWYKFHVFRYFFVSIHMGTNIGILLINYCSFDYFLVLLIGIIIFSFYSCIISYLIHISWDIGIISLGRSLPLYFTNKGYFINICCSGISQSFYCFLLFVCINIRSSIRKLYFYYPFTFLYF